MKKFFLTNLLIISLIINFLPVNFVIPAFAAEGSVSLEVSQGPVQYKGTETGAWTDVKGTMDMAQGSYINVGPGGSAIFHFPDGSSVRLYENSMITIKEVSDIGGTRNYHIRFLGKILAHVANNTSKGSDFTSDAPTTDITTNGIEYTTEVESDLLVRVKVLDGDVKASDAYNIDGTVKEISPEKDSFLLEIKDKDGNTKTLKIKLHPYTVVFDGYTEYRKTGNPDLLNDIKKLKEGQKVVVFGELSEDGTLVDASLITDRGRLPAALWTVEGGAVGGLSPAIILGAIGAVGVIIIGVTAGGGQTPVSPTQP